MDFLQGRRRGSSHAMAIFFRCSARLAFATVASPDLSATICSLLRPRPTVHASSRYFLRCHPGSLWPQQRSALQLVSHHPRIKAGCSVGSKAIGAKRQDLRRRAAHRPRLAGRTGRELIIEPQLLPAAEIRHTVLPISSAMRRLPLLSRASPTGRPRDFSSGLRKPVTTSWAAPFGCPFANGTYTTL